ncbi:recQ-mediated genome instability protein 1, variant 2 [Clonorchis sinensis]|nr:recQ-mediated genome instability protein 1, variant 2 [Clonorchis sinensis]
MDTADPARTNTTVEREMTAHDDHPPVVPMVQLVASSSRGQALEPWDNDDDALLTEAAQSFEQLMSSSSSQVSKGDFNQPETKPCSQLHSAVPNGSSAPNGDDSWDQTDISLEVDPDVLASAFDELESANLVNKPREFASPDRPNPAPSPTTAAKQGASTLKNSGTKSSLRQMVLNVTTDKPSLPALSNTDVTTTVLPTVANTSESDDLLPPAPKRKPWERKKPLPSGNQLTAGGPSTSVTSQLTNVSQGDFSFRPFCYIEDMYNELVRTTSSGSIPRRRIYTIRGLLISLLSSLEHHQGTRWTLAARLADGSATVDLDISSELLTSWIGLTAAESESLRQMSRVATTGSEANVVALQEAQKHRHRLRTALSNFQARLANLAGLFDISPPNPTSLGVGDSSEEKPIRPILVGYRPLDGDWLTQLHNRVLARWGTRVLD